MQPARSSTPNQPACLSVPELQPVVSLSRGEEEDGGSGSHAHSREDLPSHGSPWHPALPPLTQMVSASPCQASRIFPTCSSHPFQQIPCLARCCSLSALISSLCLRDTSAAPFSGFCSFAFWVKIPRRPPPSLPSPRIILTVLRGIKREVEKPSNLAWNLSLLRIFCLYYPADKSAFSCRSALGVGVAALIPPTGVVLLLCRPALLRPCCSGGAALRRGLPSCYSS